MARPSPSAAVGLIIRQMEPPNLETPLDQVDSYLTPTELFYIRSHFPAPKLDLVSYRLHIEGSVRNPLSLSYQQLREMPSETRVATLECAGNSRVFLVPQVAGAQWELGAVGNAEWTGVPLRALLERAGLREDACEIVLEGGDRGTPKEEPVPPGSISYSRGLPREKALEREVLIAYQMNGRDLPLDHGYPVRAIVPGHYGMASVKWLTHIQAVRERCLWASRAIVCCKEPRMDTPVEKKPLADLRDYLAEERTFLAWIRTGLTLMGFGFVVARFGLFLQVMQISRGDSATHAHGFSPWMGTTFIAVGVAVNLLSIRRHLRLVDELNRGQVTARRSSQQAVVLALFLALGGVAMALYLMLA